MGFAGVGGGPGVQSRMTLDKGTPLLWKVHVYGTGGLGAAITAPWGVFQGHLKHVQWQDEGQQGGQLWSGVWRDVNWGRQRLTSGSSMACSVHGHCCHLGT